GALAGCTSVLSLPTAPDHGASKFINDHSGIGNYDAAIRTHVAAAVDKPAFHIGIVVPEIEWHAWTQVKGVGIDQPGSLRACCILHLDIRPSRLHSEIKRYLHSPRQRKWRFVHGDCGDSNLMNHLAITVSNDGSCRQMQLQTRQCWVGDHQFPRRWR